MVLAICVAMLPIATAQAAALMLDHHAGAAHDHGDEAAGSDCHDLPTGMSASSDESAASHEQTSHDGEGSAFCCGSIACHAFGVSVAPTVSVPAIFAIKHAARSDQQTSGTPSARIDRPPRTV